MPRNPIFRNLPTGGPTPLTKRAAISQAKISQDAASLQSLVRIDKVLGIKAELAAGTYSEDEKLDACLDPLLRDLGLAA